MSIKLIATDMDGTLLTDDKKINKIDADAIKLATANGIKFILATGRMYEAAKPFADALQLDVPLISYNGALVKGSKKGEVLFESFMNSDLCYEVLQYCRKQNLHVQAYWGGEVYTDTLNDDSRWYSKIINKPVIEIGERLFTEKHKVYKLLIMTDPDSINDVWLDLSQRFTGRIDLTSSAQNFLEVVTPGINKWNAVKQVAESWHIHPSEIMCIGDSLNDLSMVENAKVGVAVANAHEKVRFHAKHIVADNNHGGVAEAIHIALDLE